ncbi:hypothetical protein HZQ79_19005 [Elizabethkingia anophelis]|nr:hypothetical protein [Elizabethkingia anophelis]
MKENKYYYLRVTDRKILWAVSGGVCAKCKKKIVNIETGEVYAHEAHVIARKGKNLVSFANISMHDKDCYKNLLILCPTCHIETRNWSHKALLELKTVHEKHVDNLLNGSFNPIERGEGKLFTHQFI